MDVVFSQVLNAAMFSLQAAFGAERLCMNLFGQAGSKHQTSSSTSEKPAAATA